MQLARRSTTLASSKTSMFLSNPPSVSKIHASACSSSSSSKPQQPPPNRSFLFRPPPSLIHHWNLSPSISSTPSISSLEEITAFSWDDAGILLAVATNQKQIRIYDWDVVVAADMKERRIRGRTRQNQPDHPTYLDRNDTRFDMKPSWTFSTPHVPSKLAWNPHDPDWLAVGFRNHSNVRIYDISKIAEAAAAPARNNRNNHPYGPSSSWSSQRSSTLTPSSSFCMTLNPSTSHVLRTHGVCSFSFLPQNRLLVSHKFGNTLVLWKLPSSASTAADTNIHVTVHQPQWYYRRTSTTQKADNASHGSNTHKDEEICDLMPLSSHFVLLGGSLGTIVLLNWRQCSRKAFSTQVTPTIVRQWDTYQHMLMSMSSSLGKQGTPSRSHMGVHKFLTGHATSNHKNTSYISSGNAKQTITAFGTYTISWVTSCGWILSMNLDLHPTTTSTNKSSRVTVVKKSPKVQVFQADGTKVETTATTTSSTNKNAVSSSWTQYSLPAKAPPADSVRNCLLWLKTPQAQKVLPHHDQRVLAMDGAPLSSPLTTAAIITSSQESRLSLMDADNDRIVTIDLPKLNGATQAIALHPSREWIAVASSNGRINLLNCRRED